MNFIEQDLDEKGILTLKLNRPEKLNALSSDLLAALEEIFSSAKSNKRVKGLVIIGSGKAFCAGADISRLADCDAQTGYQFALDGQRVFRALETLGKPSIAAVNGYAFGGGCELAISATLRIASSDAQFGQPEVKLGVIPGYGGTQRLARLVGKGRAMDLCLTGRFINAETALNWGLVSEVVDPDTLLDRAKQCLTGIIAKAPLAVASVMEAINIGYDLPLTEALHLEAVHFAKVCATEDKKEGVAAFVAKRQAEFKGV
ncbi:MAG: enoyl-CoA hydratase/isomerase family protein [Tatlockia sp.]|nr:enoyl-CoA hydratase/isomerase family protein [Tatlockia sp.]